MAPFAICICRKLSSNVLEAFGAMVRVFSLNGKLLQTVPLGKFTHVGDLAEEIAMMLDAPNCSLVSKNGSKLAAHLLIEKSGLCEEDDITAVAETVDPLLEMLELQDADGTLAWDNLQELHMAALTAEQRLVEVACGIGAPGHLCGMPLLEWPDKTVPPPPMFCEDGPRYCSMSMSTPVIHTGARILVFGEQGKDSKPKLYCKETPTTVADLRNICNDRPDLASLKKQIAHIDGEVVHPTIQVVSHSRHEICFQLGHEVYNLDDIWGQARRSQAKPNQRWSDEHQSKVVASASTASLTTTSIVGRVEENCWAAH